LFYKNQSRAYNLLFKAAGKTLMQCAADPKHLGVQAGAVAMLHTWGQTLMYHPHVHMIVPAGGLSEDKMERVASGNEFFLPVKVLSAIFRGILCKLLDQAIASGEICLPERIKDFQEIKTRCYQKKWVVFCEKPFKCPDNLVEYLGNYTHRVAISNQRIIQETEGNIDFWYKDYKSGGVNRRITLKSEEFIRRFLQHVLPGGFYKIRYFGFLAMCNSKEKLAKCFELIGKVSWLPILDGLNAREIWNMITGKDPFSCPICKKGKMLPLTSLSTEQYNTG
jgi:hypothetical protein